MINTDSTQIDPISTSVEESTTASDSGHVSLPQDLLGRQQAFFHGLKVKGRSENTVKNYRTDIECFNQFLLSKQKSIHLNAGMSEFHVEDFGVYLNQRYDSDNSRRRRIQTLRLFLDYLIETGHLSENPVRKLPSSPKFLDIPRPATQAEIQAFWYFFKDKKYETKTLSHLVNLRNQFPCLFIFGGALKVSDISSLKKTDLHIDKEKGEVRILVHPPRRDPYTVPLPMAIIHLAAKYFELLDIFKDRAGLQFDDLLFSANPYQIISGGLSPRGIEVIFKDACKHLNIAITPKTLRQSGIFHWLHLGHTSSQIKEWLGVAPSYNLRAYEDIKFNHVFHDRFLYEDLREEKTSSSSSARSYFIQ